MCLCVIYSFECVVIYGSELIVIMECLFLLVPYRAFNYML